MSGASVDPNNDQYINNNLYVSTAQKQNNVKRDLVKR